VARAERAIAAAGLSDRAGVHPGSFFDPLPAGAGGYLLSGVLHDWDDEHAARILHRCADAAGPAGRVLVVEHLLGGGGGTDTGGDLRMLCLAGGRERTLDELRALAGSAGLAAAAVHPVGRSVLVELRAA
jgi:hypothetical protein